MIPGQLGPTSRDRDCVRRADWTRNMSCRGTCSATETIRGISDSMASRIAEAACGAGTRTAVAVGLSGSEERVWRTVGKVGRWES